MLIQEKLIERTRKCVMGRRDQYHNTKKHRQLIMIGAVTMSLPGKSNAQIYLDSTATIESRVNYLLSKMTLDEKIGQMIQMNYPDLPSMSDIKNYSLGSLLAYADNRPAGRTPQAWADLYDTVQSYALQTRLKIPMIFAIDAVHGFGAMYGATVFPHNIGLGCTRNPQLVEQAAQITAKEMSATGIDWALGPVVAVARDERWGRTYESFGEDPNLVKEMAGAVVRGFKGDTLAKNINILACAKHFIGDGGTTGGVNNGNTVCDVQTLRAIHLPGYIAAIQQKVASIMAAQNQWNGINPHGDPYLLDTLLKQELGFKGTVISDANSFMYAGDPTVPYPWTVLYGAAIKHSINAGVDMAMMSNLRLYNHRMYIDTLKTLISQGAVTIERIDDAVKRILTQKFRLGLFEHPYADKSLLSQLGSQAHRQVARECVRQSLVVLKKKDGVLPISKNIKRIHLAGRHADNMGYQCGGWTISWQGGSGNTTIGTTIMQAVQQAVPNAEVTFSEYGYGAEGADIGIAVIGELPYAEFFGDGGIIFSPTDIETIRNLKSSGMPVIIILTSGRSLILDPILHHCDALIAAWLPGTEGEGITDVLFGDYPPVGRLTQTWPRDIYQIPINVGDASYNPLFKYGDGIISLNDSPAGSSPDVYSASVITDQSMEISFNKKMAAPTNAPAGFSVLVNGIIPANITSLSLKNSDSTTLVITFKDSIRKENRYTISYAPGIIQSLDQGRLVAFDSVFVHNLLADYKYIHVTPEKIEAEEYYRMQGIATISCSDEGGGIALSSISKGDWVVAGMYQPSLVAYISIACMLGIL